jgi:beta-N-acetylhexosaminidase
VRPWRHPDPAVRRRWAALATLAALALLAGAALGAGGKERERPRAPRAAAPPPAAADDAAPPRAPGRDAVARLSLEQQVGQLVIQRFVGVEAPGYVRQNLRLGRAAGVILFKDNIASPAGLRAMTRALRRSARHGPPIISTDQEGGEIRNLTWIGPEASQATQHAGGAVRAEALAAARALRAEGVNVNLAPVADVATVPGAAMAGRAFATTHAEAAEAMEESVRGWLEGGVAPTAKHFPGLGGSTINTDEAAATIDRSLPQIREDLEPFAAAVEAGVPIVMLSHAVYTAVDPDAIGTQSPAVIDLLRDDLGFEGVVMTDSMEAAAVSDSQAVDVAAEKAIEAGVDVILTTGQGSHIHVYRRLLERARSSPAFRERVRESAARVLALRRSLARLG